MSEIDGAQLVKVLPFAMKHDYQPSVEWMPAIKAKRLAIIARGNSPEELDPPPARNKKPKFFHPTDRFYVKIHSVNLGAVYPRVARAVKLLLGWH